jgi:hypothetical protein
MAAMPPPTTKPAAAATIIAVCWFSARRARQSVRYLTLD